jgi:hypothetical protein
MRIILRRWKLFALLTVIISALAPGSGTVTYAANPYIWPEPATSYMVQGAWYSTEVTLLEDMAASSSDTEVLVSDASLLGSGWTIQIASDSGPAEQMTVTALLSQCDNAIDDDGDTLVNDGCPTVDDGVLHPETGAQCENAVDDDGDTVVNDGCPTIDDGVLHPETGAQCGNAIDEDGDGYINDGCPTVDVGGAQPETGSQCLNGFDDDEDLKVNDGCAATAFPEQNQNNECANAVDDDGDGKVNDGCPQFGLQSETGAQCDNAVDDDSDGYVNDGCPIVVYSEQYAECGGTADDDSDGKVNDGCPAVSAAETGTQCANAIDDDVDGRVNDGCPAVDVGGPQPETGSQCDLNYDDDGDGYINDGCPAAAHPEQGSDCSNDDDDDSDGYINDGCPERDVEGEPGSECTNYLDDDSDGKINDGCPAVGTAETACNDAVDNDGDGAPNDGCPAVGYAEETDRCANAVDDDGDGYVNDGCPEYHLVKETGAQCTNSIDDDGDGYVNDGCPKSGTSSEKSTPTIMSVDRAVNGVLGTHSTGAPIQDHLFKADIWVHDVPATHPYGVGSFNLKINFNPQEFEFVKMRLDALVPESGTQCTNNMDDDGDGKVNDGCPKVGTTSETGTQCANAVDDDGDGYVNDGCPATSWLASTGRNPYCFGPTLTDDGDSASVEGSCATAGNPSDPPWPKGPTGSGRVATVWFRVLDEDQLISRRFTLTGSRVEDVSAALITSLAYSGAVRTIACPDTNLDTRINELDAANVYLNLNDTGQNSGVTLAGGIDAVQTTIPISAQGSLAVGKRVAIDNEHMLINAINTSPPLTMTVQRDLYPGLFGRAAPHASGTPIFIATGKGDNAEYGYTDPRDTNDDLYINTLDAVPIYSIVNTWCPSHTP